MQLALDTNVVLELLKARGGTDDDKAVLTLLDTDHDFVLPSLVVGEVLAKIPKNKRAAFAWLLREQWPVIGCDYDVALLAADIHNRAIDEGKAQREGRQCVKVDAFILATAVVHKCNAIVCLDKPMMRMATWLTPAFPVLRPEDVGSRQTSLFQT